MISGHTQHEMTANLSLDGVEADLRVLQFEATEGVSRLFEVIVLVACTSGQLNQDQALGRAALLVLDAQHGERRFHGMVSSITRLQESQLRGLVLHRLIISPLAWRLTQGCNHRVFSQKTVLHIVSTLLDAAKVPHRMRTNGNRAPRELSLTVQYGESDWAFICRLLEQEGLFFYFSQSPQGHCLEVVDHASLVPAIAAPNTLDLRPPGSAMAVDEQAFDFSFSRRLHTGRVVLDDYNPDRPALNLRVTSPDPDNTHGPLEEEKRRPDEQFHYPGDYPLAQQGKLLARTRREAEQAAAAGGEGRSDCARLAAGCWFTLCAPQGNETQYMLTEVHHMGEQSTNDLEGGALDRTLSYENHFCCVERAAPYRPPRKTPRPSVQGVQTALVVGQGEEEISTDKQGRVMVRFRWDRLGASAGECSCWVRVSQLMAGAGWGSIWIPRAGQEVVVAFEQGDPDRPLITGCLYHAHHLPPFGLPRHKTRSGFRTHTTPGGKGYNELSFEDGAGAEVVRLRAQRDLRVRAGNDHTTTVRQEQSITVEQGDRCVGVLKGDLTEDVAGQRVSRVGKGHYTTIQQGDDQLSIQKGSRIILVEDGNHIMNISGAALTRIKEGSYSIEVDGPSFMVRCGESELCLERDGTIKLIGKTIQVQASGNLGLKADLEMALQARRGVAINSAGGDVDVTGQTIKLNG